jgi:hypothetical protein
MGRILKDWSNNILRNVVWLSANIPSSRDYLSPALHFHCLTGKLLLDLARAVSLPNTWRFTIIFKLSQDCGSHATLFWLRRLSRSFGQSSWDQRPIFFLFFLLIFRTLRIYWCGAFSLMRDRNCSLQFLLVLASAVFLGSEFHVTDDHILLSQFRDFPFFEGQVPVLVLPRNSATQNFSLTNMSIYKFWPNLTGSTLHLGYNARPLNAVQGNCRSLLWET